MIRNSRLVRWLITVLFWGMILYIIVRHYDPRGADAAVKGIFGTGWKFVTLVWDATIGKLIHSSGHHGVTVH